MNTIFIQRRKAAKNKNNKFIRKKGIIFVPKNSHFTEKGIKPSGEFDFKEKKGTAENINPSSGYGFERG